MRLGKKRSMGLFITSLTNDIEENQDKNQGPEITGFEVDQN